MVCYGGGGVPGLCGNVALARILEQLDLRKHVSEIWGTSAGAVVGGAWATGTTAGEILALLKSLDPRSAKDFCTRELLLSLPFLSFGRELPDGLMRGRHFATFTKAGLKVENIEQCEIPFRCIACREGGGSVHKVFRAGPIFPAILASFSLPGFLPPYPSDHAAGSYYFDGGMVEKTPLLSPISEHLRSGDKRKLLIIGTRFRNEGMQKTTRGFINWFLRGFYTMQEQLWDYQLNEARSRTDVTLMLLNPRIPDTGLFDFEKVDANYAHARRMFLDLLQNAKVALTFGLR
jgi:predicted acylesterase/phospholipase RssA